MTEMLKRNSRPSGTKTLSGNSASSLNAMKSGLFARKLNLLPHECPLEYEALVQGVFDDWTPETTCEESECWQIVILLVRRQRAERFEAGAVHRSLEVNQLEAANIVDGPIPPPKATDLANISSLARRMFLDKLHTVETHIGRQLSKCYSRLAWLQARRTNATKHVKFENDFQL